MSVLLMLMVCAALTKLTACSRGGEARVRLNSIRTEILRGGQALPGNRSAWEPGLDLTLYQCMSDLECSEGSYCHAATKGPAHSRCQTCRRRRRRCHRDGMCCPGNRCSEKMSFCRYRPIRAFPTELLPLCLSPSNSTFRASILGSPSPTRGCCHGDCVPSQDTTELKKVANYKDYSMESRLHFRIHAALSSLKESPGGTP
ncbi:uncharacterized protein LOC117935157 [Etheostoma cragini]|uniref:uncharacterized protein LOC117935157 n=1 Tax=Etheostoma cragini TaxID=417921 RepID=UPI00155DEDFD|nr:uncharacterized protein LOC117935157 [Etheostoma cragini]